MKRCPAIDALYSTGMLALGHKVDQPVRQVQEEKVTEERCVAGQGGIVQQKIVCLQKMATSQNFDFILHA